MTTYFQYLLGVNIGLVLLYLAYRLILQKSQYFEGIRYYFLLGMLACLVFPLIEMGNLDWWKQVTPNSTQYLKVPVETITGNAIIQNPEPGEKTLSLLDAYIIAYLGVTFLLAARLLFRLAKLYLLISRSKRVKGECYRLSSSRTRSFTFMRHVILGKEWQQLSDSAKAHVMAHENQHAEGLHSIDLLLAQSIAAICWFNPAIWLLNRAVSINHEFLVDEKIIQQGTPIEEYAALIIDQATSKQPQPITHPFSQFSHLKQRITMMTTHQTRSNKTRIWLAIPILATIMFACNLTDFNEQNTETYQLSQEENMGLFYKSHKLTLREGLTKEHLFLSGKNSSFTMKDFLDSDNNERSFSLALREDIAENLKSVTIHAAKGRRAYGKLKFQKQELTNSTENVIHFSMEELLDSESNWLNGEGGYKLVFELDYIKPRFDQAYYERLKATIEEKRFSPYTDEELRAKNRALRVDDVNALPKLRTDKDIRKQATDAVKTEIYLIPLRLN